LLQLGVSVGLLTLLANDVEEARDGLVLGRMQFELLFVAH
jgi:hypothetical protein